MLTGEQEDDKSHNPKVGGSNPPPATKRINWLAGFPD
jgi:hypothetical protein